MTIKTKDINELLKVLRKHGVEHFKSGELELSISPIKYVSHNKKQQTQSVEDDLYYSADKFKIKKDK
jgi:hypothetical protein